MRQLLPALFSAVPLTAQMSDGPFLGCPIQFAAGLATTGPGSTTLATNNLYVKRAGFFDLTSASTPTIPGRPDFTMTALFGPPAARPVSFRLDAVSSDNCTVYGRFEATEYVLDGAVIPANTWSALLFSVTRNSLGGGTAAVAMEAGRPDGPGADLFSVVLPYSTLPGTLDCVPIAVAQRASDSSEMGFEIGAQRPELLDFDPFFTFYGSADPMPSYLDPEPWFYFSLPRSTVLDPFAQPFFDEWFTRRASGGLSHTQRCAATILRTRWNRTSMQWSPPEVFLSFAELGLSLDDDIDALAIDKGHQVVLLSLRQGTPSARTDLGHQLMVAGYRTAPSFGITHTARPWVYDNGTDTNEKVGKIAGAEGGGEIDATCPVDPSSGNGLGSVAFGYTSACRSDFPTFPVTMGASAMATASSGPGLRTFAINLSGAPAGGFAGMVIGFPGPGGGPTLGGPSLLFLGTPSSFTYEWSIAASPTQLGFELDFQWAASNGLNIELARTARLRL